MNASKNWIELHLPLSGDMLERVSALLFSLGADGLEEKEGETVVYFPREKWTNETRLLLTSRLEQILPGYEKKKWKEQIIKEENWNEAWKEYFKTFHLTERIVIAPDWSTYQPEEDESLIIISPKMAFGTGHHETTQLILEWLENNLKPGMRVLDAGTGSGILAIYAAQNGAHSVTAFDVDPLATENAAENARLNNVEDRIAIYKGGLEQVPLTQYDLILANINRNVLLDLAGPFGRYLKKNGLLLLSGILKQDEEILRTVYEKSGYRMKSKHSKGEWLALLFQRQSNG